jgi:phosphoribosylglycinamide formyltransferase-1
MFRGNERGKKYLREECNILNNFFTMRESKLRVASLISGGGTTMESVAKATQSGELKDVELVGIIASKADAGGIEKAKRLGIPTFVVARSIYKTREEFGEQILAILKQLGVDLVSQNGWLPMTPSGIVCQYETINQHPGPLDPDHENRDFGGKGMYGSRVSCARLAYGWLTEEVGATTESTVHHVTDEEHFDQGGIISAVPVPISPYVDNFHYPIESIESYPDLMELLRRFTEEIQKILLPIEHENVKKVLEMYAQGKVPSFHRGQPLIPSEKEIKLKQAKQLASQLFPKG